jgi:hypothetical protein
VPIERRIRQGAERNAGVLDPDVDRFLDSVVHKGRRRQVVRRSLSAAASVAAVVLVVALGPSVLHGIGDTTDGSVPGNESISTVTPVVPLVTGTFTRSIPEGTALVRVNGIAGTWTISAGADGRVRLVAPASFAGAHASRPFEMQADTLSTVAFGSDICQGLPAGRYTWSRSGDFLLISAISDPCDARVFILGAHPWPLAS